MAARLRLAPMVAIALFLAGSGFGGPGSRVFEVSAGPLKAPSPVPSAASASAAASHDPNYYAYATRYYLQYLSSREQVESNAKDPYYFFNYYQFYRERYAPGSSNGQASAVPAWFATMPFRNARTQSFARFVQVASPSAAPSPLWVQPFGNFQRTAGK